MSNQLEKVKELIALRETARLGGGEKRIESQHKKGTVSYTHLTLPTILRV